MLTLINQDVNAEPRLLLVDPDEAAAKLLKAGMSAGGWQVDHAGTLQKALLLAANSVYDFVILDLVLPDASAVRSLGVAPKNISRYLGRDNHLLTYALSFRGSPNAGNYYFSPQAARVENGRRCSQSLT